MTHELNLEYVTLNLATSGAYECMAVHKLPVLVQDYFKDYYTVVQLPTNVRQSGVAVEEKCD